MTVSYIEQIPLSGLGIYKILTIWKGSLYKAIWRPLLVYLILYFILRILYRFVLIHDEFAKQKFETLCVFLARYEDTLPLQFLLGFYVAQVL